MCKLTLLTLTSVAITQLFLSLCQINNLLFQFLIAHIPSPLSPTDRGFFQSCNPCFSAPPSLFLILFSGAPFTNHPYCTCEWNVTASLISSFVVKMFFKAAPSYLNDLINLIWCTTWAGTTEITAQVVASCRPRFLNVWSVLCCLLHL